MKLRNYPKSFQKTVRFIFQDTTLEQLESMEKFFKNCISKRKRELKNQLEKKGNFED